MLNLSLAITLIELAGALIIFGYAVVAFFKVFRGASVDLARYIVANGAIAGLNFKVAASLLKTVQLQTWHQIAMFVFVFALRIILKRIFQMDMRMQQASTTANFR